jgi:hypothetical protein
MFTARIQVVGKRETKAEMRGYRRQPASVCHGQGADSKTVGDAQGQIRKDGVAGAVHVAQSGVH